MIGVGVVQPWHLLLILLIVLVVFGAGKLSQAGGALGQSVKEFKRSVAEGEGDDGAGRPVAAASAKAGAEQEQAAAAAPHAAQLLQREEI